MPVKGSIEDSGHSMARIRLAISIIRHDMLNQVSVIRGCFEFLSDHPSIDPALNQHLNRMMKAADCIRRQIEFTEYFLEQCNPHRDWYSLESVIQNALSEHAIVDVKVSIDPGDIEILTDPLMIRVFANLIDNAVRHGGSITELRIAFARHEDHGLIVIEDDGTGIPDEEKYLIFSPGYGHNTGMGLYLAKLILETMGFSIQETGREGNGARFEIRIPRGHYRPNN